jgi:hypothetical protein
MLTGVDIRTVIKRGALVAAANWQVTVIQFVAESTFKMLLSVPVVGGLLLVVLVLGRELPGLFSPDIRESITFVATALSAGPADFVPAGLRLVALAGSRSCSCSRAARWRCSPSGAEAAAVERRHCAWSPSGRPRGSA